MINIVFLLAVVALSAALDPEVHMNAVPVLERASWQQAQLSLSAALDPEVHMNAVRVLDGILAANTDIHVPVYVQ